MNKIELQAIYNGPSMCGFKNGHKYTIEFKKEIYGYSVYGICDLTDNCDSNAVINYASRISFKQRWDVPYELVLE